MMAGRVVISVGKIDLKDEVTDKLLLTTQNTI